MGKNRRQRKYQFLCRQWRPSPVPCPALLPLPFSLFFSLFMEITFGVKKKSYEVPFRFLSVCPDGRPDARTGHTNRQKPAAFKTERERRKIGAVLEKKEREERKGQQKKKKRYEAAKASPACMPAFLLPLLFCYSSFAFFSTWPQQ